MSESHEELRAIVAELHRLGLVLDSCVRFSEGTTSQNAMAVTALIKRASLALHDVTPPEELGDKNPARLVLEARIEASDLGSGDCVLIESSDGHRVRVTVEMLP